MASCASKLPGWRRPLGLSPSIFHGENSVERDCLREVLLDLMTDEPQSWRDLAAGAREHWGPASAVRVTVQLRELIRDGRVKREGNGYVRVELDDGEGDE